MTQLSKRYLPPNVQKRMYEILIKAISKARLENDVINFLTDLLSLTEQAMLAKRLAIAYLLVENKYTRREISKILKVSLTTIQRVSLTLNIQGTGYRKIVQSLVKDEKIEEFMNKIATIITSVPPKGRNWNEWRKEREQLKKTRRKAF